MLRRLAPIRRWVLVFFFLFPSNVFATQVLRTSAEQMAQRSDMVLHARVVDQRVEWNTKKSRVLTLTTLEIINAIKGKARESIVVYQVGGTLDGVTYKIPGAIKLEKGEEIIFFGVRFRDMIASYGMGLGKFVVSRTGKSATVLPHYGDVEFVTRQSDGRIGKDTHGPDSPQPLAAFIARIKKAVKGRVR
jgi:hypothetical protein